MEDWPDQVKKSEFKEISTLPKGVLLPQIFLRDEKIWTSAMVLPNGTIVDGINHPEKDKTFFPTHWAYISECEYKEE
jgi:hypothetical protein